MIQILVIVACLILTAIFAALEIAFISTPKTRIRKYARDGRKGAAELLKLRENPERTLSVLQIVISLLGGISAAVGGASAEDWFTPWILGQYDFTGHFWIADSLAIALIIIPLIYVEVMAELLGKNFALRNGISIALNTSRWLVWADRVFLPFVNILEKSTLKVFDIMRRISPVKAPQESSSETTVDIEALPDQQRQYVLNLISIENRSVKEIMLPWNDVLKIQSDMPIQEVNNVVLGSGHTRIPVCEGTRILGILHTKEFLAFQSSGQTDWPAIVRPPLAILETSPILNALKMMQLKRSHMIVIFAKDGTIRGIVTMEDIIEEVIGDLYDENDDGSLKKILATKATIRT